MYGTWVSMYVCVCMHICTKCVYVCLCVCVCVYDSILCTYLCNCVYIYVFKYVDIFVCM